MRKFIFFIVLIVASCDVIDEFTKFDIEYNTQVTIPSSTGINLPFNINTPETETNSENTFESNDTRKELIEEIKLTKLELVLSSPSDADFSFLESVDVYISAEGLDEVKIASKTEVPEMISVLSLDVFDTDLKEYIKKDRYKLRLNTVTDEVITSDHTIDINSTFFVDAKILGI